MKTNKKNLIISQLELTKRIKLSLLLFSLKKLCYCKVIILYVFAFPFLASAQQSLLPWLKNIDPQDKIRMIHTIIAEAEVTVSDGLVYKANSIFHDKQRAVFQLVYSNRTIAQAVEGKYIWEYDGKVETEASSSVEEFILGHQIHAQILFFDKLHQSIGTPKPGKFLGKDCFTLASDDKNSPFNFYYEESGQPIGMEIPRAGEKSITFKFDDWRSVQNITLPFAVLIEDGKRTFEYRYTTLSLNDGSIAEFRALENVLTEEQKLLRLHRIIVDGHLFGQTSEMKTIGGDSMVIVSDGDIYAVVKSQSDAMFDDIMKSRNYTSYDDLIRPVVKISNDGILAWVIAQVYAEGVRFDSAGNPNGPLEFVCAWIELYKKVQDKWKWIGNVSNFRADRK